MADDAGRLETRFWAETSFLYGGNAGFVEDLHDRWAVNPGAVEPSWRAFFETIRDKAGEAASSNAQPSWTPEPIAEPRPEWLSAIDGLWPALDAKLETKIAAVAAPAATADEIRARTLDSLRAIMMIRAYRMRGHLRANLDPLGLAVTQGDASELDPARYGFAESDYDRPIFLDYVLGLETATLREMLEILRRTYCGNVGVQYMHISDPSEKAWLQQRIEGRDKEIAFTRQGKIAILKKLIETEGFERFLHKLPRHQAVRPRRRRVDGPGAGADHQAQRRAGQARHRHLACRTAAASNDARGGDGQALPGDLPRVPRRLVAAVGRRRLRRREVPPRR